MIDTEKQILNFWHQLNPNAITPPTKDEIAKVTQYWHDTDIEVAAAILEMDKLRRTNVSHP